MSISDLRTAIRLLQHSRGFAAIAILTLGCGLMLCITAFAVANAYLLRTLPYPAADRLFTVQYAPPGQRAPREMERLEWRTLDDIVEHPIAWDLDMFYVLGGPYPESAPGAWVTPGYMQGFGIRAAIGRAFEASDFQRGRPQVALISHRLWRTRFAGDAAIVGRTFSAYVSDRPDEAETFTVIGVLPADFWHTNPYTEVLAPLRVPTYPYVVPTSSLKLPGDLHSVYRPGLAGGHEAQTPPLRLILSGAIQACAPASATDFRLTV